VELAVPIMEPSTEPPVPNGENPKKKVHRNKTNQNGLQVSTNHMESPNYNSMWQRNITYPPNLRVVYNTYMGPNVLSFQVARNIT